MGEDTFGHNFFFVPVPPTRNPESARTFMDHFLHVYEHARCRTCAPTPHVIYFTAWSVYLWYLCCDWIALSRCVNRLVVYVTSQEAATVSLYL